jgi:uncharacterized protein Veg
MQYYATNSQRNQVFPILLPSQHLKMQNHELYDIIHKTIEGRKRTMAQGMKGREEGYPSFIIIVATRKENKMERWLYGSNSSEKQATQGRSHSKVHIG